MHEQLEVETILSKVSRLQVYYGEWTKETLSDEETYVTDILMAKSSKFTTTLKTLFLSKEILLKLIQWKEVDQRLLHIPTQSV